MKYDRVAKVQGWGGKTSNIERSTFNAECGAAARVFCFLTADFTANLVRDSSTFAFHGQTSLTVPPIASLTAGYYLSLLQD